MAINQLIIQYHQSINQSVTLCSYVNKSINHSMSINQSINQSM